MRRLLVIAVVLVVLAGGIYGAAQLLSRSSGGGSGGAVKRSVPSYHAMPAPAEKTKVTVGYATKPTTPAASKPPFTPVPFTQCSRSGRDCGEVIQVTGSGAPRIEADPGSGPYDGSAATLVGVVNSSTGTISALRITADTSVFAFAGDGACGGRFSFFEPASGCPFGPTGYEGPDTSFAGITTNGTAGTVTFAKPLAPGKTAWFSLAQALAATSVAGDGPTAAEQGGAPNPAEDQSACSQQPVNCATGALWEEFTDMSVPGHGAPLLLTRTYVSADANTPSPFGYGWTDSYAMRLVAGAGGTETVVQEDGSAVTFQPDGHGGYTAPSRVLAALASATTPDGDAGYAFFRYGSRIKYYFTASGQLDSEADANGNVTQLTYNADGTLQAVTDPEDRSLSFQYTDGRVSQVTDPMGHTETYGYTGGRLTSVTNDVSDTWHFGYQPGTNLLTSLTNPRGYTTRITYRGDRVSSVTEPGLGTTDWSYSGESAGPGGGTTAEQEPGKEGQPNGAVVIYNYRALELTAVTSGAGTPDAQTTGYTYTTGAGAAAAGLISSQTDPELGVTRYAYDADGNLIAVTNPLRQTTTYAYQGSAARWGEVTKVTMPGPGAPHETYTYDQQNGNLLESTDGDGDPPTKYVYGDVNDSDLLSVSGPDEQQTAFQYDADGDVTAEAVTTGNGTDTSRYAYDLDGHLTCEDSPAMVAAGVNCPSAPWGTPSHVAGTESFAYDGAGEQTSVTSPAGGVTQTTYDPDGGILKVTVTGTGGTGGASTVTSVTEYSYNAADEETLQTAVKPGGEPVVTATFNYYPDGEPAYQAVGPVSASDARVSRDGYDLLGQLTSVTDPLGDVTSYSYGRDGELAAVTDPSGRVTSYAYNAAGELTGVRYSDGSTPPVRYAYYPDGQPSAMTDGTGTTNYSYDGDGVLTSARGAAGGYTYKYDAATGTGLLTYPHGQQVTDTYDQAGQLVKVTDWLGDTITFKYAPGGGLYQESFPGGVQVTDNTAGNGDDLKVTGGSASASFTDDREPDGRLSSVATTGIPGATGTVSYGYDAAGWLTSAGQQQLGYDAAGGLTTPSAGVTQQFNAAAELMPGGAASYRYDKEGDLTAATVPGSSPQRLSYNQAGELTGYQSGPTTASYAYDGQGMLAGETVNGAATGFTWDTSGSSPELLAAGATSYVYGPGGQPVEQVTGSTATFLISDQQGNTRLLTSASGAVVGTYAYGAYGAPVYSCPDGQGATCTRTALQYGGQYTDSASGDLYLGGRYYDPATGQYLTRASAGANALAPYAFAGDDPVNTGLTSLTWEPETPAPGFWAQWGGALVDLVNLGADLMSDGDDPGEEGPAGGSGGASEEGEELAEDEALEEEPAGAGSAQPGVTAQPGTAGASSARAAQDTEEELTDEGGDPVTGSTGKVNSAAEPDNPAPQPSPSCWALPGITTTCQQFLVSQLKQVDVKGLLDFINDSIDAVQTCTDPHKDNWDCAQAALKAASGLPDTRKD